jgi:uncharacterized protein YfbU (UPF0304 family)
MTNEEIIREFSSLPSEARREVIDFIRFLKSRYRKNDKTKSVLELSNEKFVGMWEDREDLQDSSRFVRDLRRSEWTK